jgi:hypothetical protein
MRGLHSTNSQMSGCQYLRVCIFAARRSLPPDLTMAAIRSYMAMKETGPDAVPPHESRSLLERSVDRSVPVPEPRLNSIASDVASRMILPISSSTDWIKHAEICGCLLASGQGMIL